MVDFEDNARAPGAETNETDVTSNGYLFDSLTNHSHLANKAFGADSGSTFYGTDDDVGANLVTMTRVGGGAFDLASLDAALWFPAEGSTSLQITGYLLGGGTTSTIIALGAFTTFNLSWTGLTSVAFDSIAGTGRQYYALDNITVAAVPVPAALPLMGGALALLGFAGWRRRREDYVQSHP